MINYLLNVEKNLWNIMELKYKKNSMSKKEFLKKYQNKNIKLSDLIQLDSIGFYYHTKKEMTHN